MDNNYDVQGAQNALERLCVGANDKTSRRLADLANTANWNYEFAVARLEQPQTWRLLKSDEDNSVEELVFSLQGIICGKDLPPLLEKPIISPMRYKYLRQSVTITGLGTPTFGDAIKSTHEIFDVFQRQFSEGQVEPWRTALFSTHDSIELSNRYLTPKRDAPDMVHIPFSEDVDPRGILEDMAKSGYAHGEDNKVSYYRCQIDAEGNKNYVAARPQSFRIGDIVETQLSIVVVPLRGNANKMMAVLRSIVLLDSTFSQEAQMKRSLQNVIRAKPTLKRKVGYEIRAPHEKRAHMDVDSSV